MSDYVPGEILIQILARLPVKSLIKLRCVSKSWYSLITSPDFINTHLNLNKNKNNKFLFLKHIDKVFNPLGEDECFYSLHHEDTLDQYACLKYPFTGYYYSSDFKVVGSCNGLLCFSRFLDETIILWNPSIQKYVTLPTPNFTYSMHGAIMCVVGFSFDNRANDYKVVRLAHLKDQSKLCPPKVELCELSKGYWRGISCNAPPYSFSSNLSQAYINGVVHWIAVDRTGSKVNGYRYLIVAFNMVDEVFHEMTLPDSIAGVCMNSNMSIGTFEESLVVYRLDKRRSNNHHKCSVWMMKEYGVAKSWVNQFNLVLGRGLKNVQSLMKNGELLLGMTSGKLVLCNPRDQKMKNIVIFGDPNIRSSWYVGSYMESLVLLEGRQTDSCDAVTSRGKRMKMRSSSAQQY